MCMEGCLSINKLLSVPVPLNRSQNVQCPLEGITNCITVMILQTQIIHLQTVKHLLYIPHLGFFAANLCSR